MSFVFPWQPQKIGRFGYIRSPWILGCRSKKLKDGCPNRDGCGQLPANVPSARRRCNGWRRRRYPPTVRPIRISHGIFRRCIVVESVNRSSDEKRTQRRAGITCPSLLFCICKSVGTYQCYNVPTNLRIHISIGMAMPIGRYSYNHQTFFLLASADGKVCIELLDTFRGTRKPWLQREKSHLRSRRF